MLRLNTALILASFSLSLTAACGDDGGGGDSVAIGDFCADDTGAFNQFVAKLVECSPEIEFFLGEIPSEASVTAACNAEFDPYINDGTVEFGPKSELDACLAAILAADCTTLEPDDLPVCDGVTIGQIELGQACENNDQCAGEAYCASAGDGCGSCAALLPDGQSCVDGSDCLNHNCKSDNTCGIFGLVGATCADTEDCAGRLICDSASACAEAPIYAVGDTCVEFGDCGLPFSNLFCNEQMMVCEAFIPLGDDCNNGTIALGLCNLLNYESCDATGTRKCIAPTTVGLGDQCNFATGLKCGPGLVCSGGAGGRCAATGLGETCNPDSEAPTCGFFLECKADGKCDYEDVYTGMCPAPV